MSPSKLFRAFLAIAAVAVAICSSPLVSAADRPNIVFIMADDLGWADVGYNGAEFYETPHIDRIRAAGMAFENAYPGASNCMPSRACIMSGMYTPRTQMWTPGGKAKGSKHAMKLLVPRAGDKTGNATFPSKLALEPAVTSIAEVLGMVGYKTARFGKWHLGADTQGFDISDSNGKSGAPEKNHYGNIDMAESLTDAAVRFIEKNKAAPFFLYLCHWDVHTPIRARKEVVAKYQKKLDSKTWSRKWNTTYAAMIEAVDTSVGRVWKQLQDSGVADNTLLVFTSDNGGHSGATFCAPLKGAKGAFYEGGLKVPMCISWPAVIQPGSHCATPVTGVDWMPTLTELAKASLPAKQPVDGRSIVSLMRSPDAPTPLDDRAIFWHYPLYLSGAQYNKVLPIHGTDRPFWRATPCSVIRRGDWKLIQFFEDDSTQLYNLRTDVSEQNDLAQSDPARAATLLTQLKQWQMDTRAVIPTAPNPDYDPLRVRR
ncbi:MAG: arylsulfatase A-like enzyme [Verrucomicrobiales bacterium]|jgi:arylsulfatase A-like enzyme